MNPPDQLVVRALGRHGPLNRAQLRRMTQLAEPTLEVSLRKLDRMGFIKTDAEQRIRLTHTGRRTAKSLRR